MPGETEIMVRSRGQGDPVALTVQESDTVRDLKLTLLKQFGRRPPTAILAGKHNCAILKLTFPDGTTMPLADNELSVKEMVELPSFKGAIVDFKQVGAQISYRGVFIIEYLGPLLLMLLLYSRPAFLYGAGAADQPMDRVASTGVLLWCIHYIKRELETLFIHKFSRETMPLMNLFKNSAHYWLAALYVGYPLCSPSYVPPTSMSSSDAFWPQLLIPAFAAAQFVNFAAHAHFAQLRKGDGDSRRPMPSGPLFALVSCPNYTAEVLIWVFFSIYTGLWQSWLFAAVGYYQIQIWGLKKHRNYKKEYGKEFRIRASVVPFLL